MRDKSRDVGYRIAAESINVYEQAVARLQATSEAVQEAARIRLLLWLRVEEVVARPPIL